MSTRTVITKLGAATRLGDTNAVEANLKVIDGVMFLRSRDFVNRP